MTKQRASKVPTLPLQEHVEKMSAASAHFQEILGAERDLRYQQRWEAQNKAVEAAMIASEKAINAALLAAEKAVSKAEIATEKRFEGANEFRASLEDITRSQVPRAEYLAGVGNLSERVQANTDTQNRNAGGAARGVSTNDLILRIGALIIGVSGIVLAILNH